jgi:CRISPR/Cas system-associated exonuclease Cas4 (RecB family)
MIAATELGPANAAAKKQPEAPRDYLQKTISASRLGLWLTCRLKFYFRYIAKIQKPPTPAKHAGSTVHAVLQNWNMARWRQQPFEVERFKLQFQSQWIALQAGVKIQWDGEELRERQTSWYALQHYFMATPIKADEKPEAVEVSVETDLSKHGLPCLIGVIDLVRSGGRIVDFKAVAKTPDPEQVAHTNEVQLVFYSLMYRDATGRKEASVELHHLVRTKTPKLVITPLPPASEQQQTRLFRQIESYQRGLALQDFVPSPGFHCAGCDYFEECRSWHG